MKFNLKELNPFTRFYFDDEDKSKGFVDLRIAPAQKLKEITNEIFKEVVVFKKGARIVYKELKKNKTEDSFSLLLWDYCIGDWSGIMDENNKPVECIAENKHALIVGSPLFDSIITDFMKRLSVSETNFKEESEKNELTTQKDCSKNHPVKNVK